MHGWILQAHSGDTFNKHYFHPESGANLHFHSFLDFSVTITSKSLPLGGDFTKELFFFRSPREIYFIWANSVIEGTSTEFQNTVDEVKKLDLFSTMKAKEVCRRLR